MKISELRKRVSYRKRKIDEIDREIERLEEAKQKLKLEIIPILIDITSKCKHKKVAVTSRWDDSAIIGRLSTTTRCLSCGKILSDEQNY